MSQSHADQITYLLYFIAFLIVVIFVPIAASLLRKKSSPPTVANEHSSVEKLSENNTELLNDQQNAPDQNLTLDKTSAQGSTQEPFIDSATKSSVKDKDLNENSQANLKTALQKTSVGFFGRIKNAFNKDSISQVRDEIEEILYTSDLGPQTVEWLLSFVDQALAGADKANLEKVKSVLSQQMIHVLEPLHSDQIKLTHVDQILTPFSKSENGESSPKVLMVVGVNGAGKTTSIGKITAQLAQKGFKVLVAAGDTFRAAAGGQLKVWTDRAQTENGHVEIFWPEKATDPAAVAFDAVQKGKAAHYDYIILDTAGRLHTQSHLMEELKKVKRVMTKVIPEAPHETWIVLDANSGQNALNQATEFNKSLEITGVVLTKMDGTAKGGVALGVCHQLQKPIRLVGLGEKINDLQIFNYKEYVDSLLNDPS